MDVKERNQTSLEAISWKLLTPKNLLPTGNPTVTAFDSSGTDVSGNILVGTGGFNNVYGIVTTPQIVNLVVGEEYLIRVVYPTDVLPDLIELTLKLTVKY